MSSGLRYVAIEELGDRPHVLVDGATRPGSVLTLSHWPQSPTPPALQRDLSAEIVFAFLHAEAEGRLRLGRADARQVERAIRTARTAEAVTNDHFDEDGLVSVFAMTDPRAALGRERFLVEVASCGDFGVVESPEAARVAFSIQPLASQAVGARGGGTPGAARAGEGELYRAALERALELFDHPERFRPLWEEEDSRLAATREALQQGAITIAEVPEVDLAIVSRPRPAPWSRRAAAPIHEVAVNSSTAASRVLVLDEAGECFQLYLRYESWVRYRSRVVPLRPDLAPLAETLSAAEPGDVRWRADGVGTVVTRLHPEPAWRSDLDPSYVASLTIGYLRRAPGAWDPFREGGSIIPQPPAGRRAR
jgi:hypothetical protein